MERLSSSNNGVMTPGHLFGDLMMTRFSVRVTFDPNAVPATHGGSAWRGLLGWEVMSLVCPFDRRPACSACIVRENCPYFLLMEKESFLPGLAESPKGYIISPEPADAAGTQRITIALVGSCTRFLPVVLQAILTAQQRGIGADRFAYRVDSVEEMAPDGSTRPLCFSSEGILDSYGPWPLREWLPKAEAAPVTLRLVTPVRLRRKGKYQSEMDWSFYLATLARRLEALNRVFNDGDPLGKTAWAALTGRFDLNGAIQTQVYWKDSARYSSRQRQKVPMGGMVGRAVMAHSPSWLTQWWKAAELLHVGKGASMGWGKLIVQ